MERAAYYWVMTDKEWGMRQLLIGSLILCSLFASVAKADDVTDGTGNQLVKFCDASNKASSSSTWFGCMMFVDGVITGAYTVYLYEYNNLPAANQATTHFNPDEIVRRLYHVCMPDGVPREQRALVVAKYLQDHPGELNRPSAVLVVHALIDAWPCPNK